MKLFRRAVSLILCLCILAALTACGGGKGKSGSGETVITINDGQIAEMQLIHYMVKLLVEAHTDVTVDIKDEMTPVNSYNEIVSGRADLMNTYDGTLLATFLQMDPSDVPEGKTLHEFASETASEKDGVHLMGKMGMENTYCIAVRGEVAQQYGLKTVSDLIPVAGELVFGAEHEFFSEEGTMRYGPFVEFYGLNFKDYMPVDISLKYSAIENASFDVTEVYSTDGLNTKAGLVMLDDDREFFPEYNEALLVRNDLFERFVDTAPNLEEVLQMLEGQFTDQLMCDLTYAVDVEGRSVPEVAEEFLKDKGLI